MSWKPEGRNAVSPYLLLTDAEATLAFLSAAFGAVTILTHRREDGTIMHAESRIDDSVIMLSQMPPAAAPAMVHVYVPDAEAAYARALAAGAAPIQPPIRKEDGDLRAGVTGPDGIQWWMATAG